MSLFKRKSKPIVGIDISSTSVKLVELSKQSKGYQVEAFGIASLPKGAVVEKNINDVDAVSDVIRQLIGKSKCKVKEVAVAVAGSSVITKVINMPAGLSEDALEDQITVEADQYIPFPLDEVSMDFEVQGQEDEDSGQMQVLLAACRKENIDLRQVALEQAGLIPKVVDIEAYAIERVLPLLMDELDAGQLVAIIDIGASVSTLSVLKDGKTVYSREQLFGGNNLTDEIQRRYGLSQEEAEQAKIHGGLPDDYLVEALEPFKESVLQQITRSLQFFYSSGSDGQVDHIVLAGGVANLSGLAPMVQSNLEVLVTIANSFEGMSCSSKVNRQQLTEVASSLMVATGLAMRGDD
ncbi:MAG: type IV pilus assembly protein PilM [Candidatus Endobugula sp.]|jgi:type IV pilus assembly protein PilM